MQSGDLLSSDVEAFESRVLVNGVEREHASWDVSRELAGEFPDQVVAVAGITQVTGTIVWVQDVDVTDSEIHPWAHTNGWPPSPGDEVIIWAGDGATEWRQFTGVIDENSGDVGEGMSSTIIDTSDTLNTPFECEPMTGIVPSSIDWQPYVRVDLSAWSVASRALSVGGFPATPPLEKNTVLSVSCQETIWPEVGDIISADETLYPVFNEEPWGFAVSTVDAAVTVDGKSSSEPVQTTFMVAPDHAGTFTILGVYEGTNFVIRCGVDRSVAVIGYGSTVGGFSAAQMTGATIVTLLIKDGVWELRNDAGVERSWDNPGWGGTGPLYRVDLAGDASTRVAGIMVSHPSPGQEFASTGFVPAVKHYGRAMSTSIVASPTLEGRTARDVVEEISKATLTGMWIDEYGVLNWASSHILRYTAPAQTVTLLDDVRSLAWEDSLLAVRSMVRVLTREAALALSPIDNITLYRGSGDTLEAGQRSEEFISAPDDEDWVKVNVDTQHARVDINHGRGTLLEGIRANDDDETFVETWAAGYLERSMERVGLSTFKLIHEVSTTLPAGESVILVLPSNDQTPGAVPLNPRRYGEKMPVIRGRIKTMWADAHVDASERGPANAPALEHDLGPWGFGSGTTQTAAERIADYIASWVTKRSPTITGMRLGYDPRRQLGDVIRIVSETILGVELTAMIVSIQNSASGSYTQTVAVRIITAKSTYTSYDQLAEAWDGGDYNSLDAFWAAQTYDDMAATPLGA